MVTNAAFFFCFLSHDGKGFFDDLYTVGRAKFDTLIFSIILEEHGNAPALGALLVLVLLLLY